MKNFIWILCALAFIGVFCAGCSGALAAERYAESERYTAGNFTYSAAAVRKIDLHWVNGRVDVLRGGADTLSVSESGDSLTDAQKLHWLLDGDTLVLRVVMDNLKLLITNQWYSTIVRALSQVAGHQMDVEILTQEEIEAACRAAQAHDFIMSFPDGYDTDLGQGGVNVSGGQKQRLCIARALLRRPKILILDDSTSAVDTKTDAKIREGLASYLPNTTKLIIAQRISSVQDADRIIVMEGGHIAQIGTHDELLQSCPVYQEICRSQYKKEDAQ